MKDYLNKTFLIGTGCHLFNGVVCAGAILLLTATASVQAQYIYTRLSVPGAENTYAYGISGNNIVGVFGNASGLQSFLYNGSSYSIVNVPGAYAAQRATC